MHLLGEERHELGFEHWSQQAGRSGGGERVLVRCGNGAAGGGGALSKCQGRVGVGRGEEGKRGRGFGQRWTRSRPPNAFSPRRDLEASLPALSQIAYQSREHLVRFHQTMLSNSLA